MADTGHTFEYVEDLRRQIAEYVSTIEKYEILVAAFLEYAEKPELHKDKPPRVWLAMKKAELGL